MSEQVTFVEHAYAPTSSSTRASLQVVRRPGRAHVLLMRCKHGLDRLAAFFGLMLLMPLLLLVGVLICRTSDGPALFTQERIGRHGRPFQIFKFRTMVNGADARLADLLVQHGRSGSPLFKVPDDPRITPLGRFLRKYSIDELPQLINVVRGEMSLVGPRPQRAEEVALYKPADRARLNVRPGLTGLWQVNGRSDVAWDDAIHWDLTYVHQWSPLMDFRILVRTLSVVVRGSGAQ